MPQLKSEGIVLKSVNWKENSRFITFFTEDSGRQSIVDRGGRSLKSKRGRPLTFSRLDIGYFKSEKTGTGYLSEVEPLESYLFEKDGSLGRLTFASAAVELLYDLLPDDEPQRSLYHLTIQFLRLTDKSPKSSLFPIFLGYFMKFLSQLGYRPNFAGCVGCGKDVKDFMPEPDNSGPVSNGLAFSPDRGGLVCSACQIPGEYYIKLHPERLKTAYGLQTASLLEAAEIRIKYKDSEDILELLKNFLKYQTDTRDLKSLEFLGKLKKIKM